MDCLREANVQDIPELTRLRLAYFHEEFGMLESAVEAEITAQLPRYFAAHLGKDCFCWVAEKDDGKLCACVIFCLTEKPANPHFPSGKSGIVLGVFTEPAYRGRGYATGLMEQLIAAGKAMGLDVIQLSATRFGKPIYERLGFTLSHSDYTEMELALR